MNSIFAITALISLLFPVFGKGYARRRGMELGWVRYRFWVPVGAFCLLASLIELGLTTGAWPMATVQGGLQTLALLLAIAWQVLRRTERMEAAGVILLALVGMLIATSLIEPPSAGSAGVENSFVAIHLGLIFLGLVGYAVSFALSSLFLVQRRRLKNKILDGIQELPSLETLDGLNFRTQSLGFVALTSGIAMGFFLILEVEPTRSLNGPTIWGTGAVWLWYAIGLQTRLVGGWRGKTAAVFGVVGFVALGLIVGLAALFVGGWHGV
jgi:ABC-type uncharacterized transport system permease subunit